MICADCIHWTMGDTWESPQGNDHGVIVESKGWCLAKSNKRKRWNYTPSSKCKLFEKRKQNGIMISGNGIPTEEQLETIMNFLEENL